MPIDYSVYHERRIVVARCHGKIDHRDLFGYQREVWSRADVAGYDELVDMTAVEEIVEPTVDRIMELAGLSAEMDVPSSSRSRFAIVAPQDLAFGLGRMYAAYRNLEKQSNKQVITFRSLKDALAYLGLENLGEPAA